MTLKELENTLVNRRQGIANNIYMLASLTRHPLISDFPKSPEEAFPTMFPKKEGIPMPDFLIEKAVKRGVI